MFPGDSLRANWSEPLDGRWAEPGMAALPQQAPDQQAPQQRDDGWWSDRLMGTLVSALALHDCGSATHSERVAVLAVDLAHEVGFVPRSEEAGEIWRGALMHDVGKLGISTDILQKPGPLDDAEWEEMRKHPEFGYQMLKDVPSLASIAEMVFASHERWDGHGYPRGLAGEEIPLGARIFILADAWDAMTSDRPYRRALPLDEVMREVRDNRGTQFDPMVTDALEQLLMRPGNQWVVGEGEAAA
jgi:HD-GYP domain-containing protein (c-di-GMP phosphodiesterase class II)